MITFFLNFFILLIITISNCLSYLNRFEVKLYQHQSLSIFSFTKSQVIFGFSLKKSQCQGLSKFSFKILQVIFGFESELNTTQLQYLSKFSFIIFQVIFGL
jgi:membrane-bound acyltransferase YfiQ involved in biofilm formation